MKNQRKWSQREINFLENNLKLKDEEIAKRLNRSKYSIRGKRYLLGHIKKNASTKYSINLDFFKMWSQNMAYILGFIYADGYIRVRKHKSTLQLTQNEIKILYKINTAMYSTYPIKKDRLRNIYRLSISRKEIVRDLIALGVEIRKSKVLKFPNVPRDYFWHFLRGYFDGDGSASVSKNFLTIAFSSGSSEILNKLKLILETQYEIPCSINARPDGSEYSLLILSKGKKKFFTSLYKNAEIFLERKNNFIKAYYENREKEVKTCKRCLKIIGNYLSKKNYCENCRRLARLETYRRYHLKRGKKRSG